MPDEIPLELHAPILSCFPNGTQILEAHSYRPGYLLFPMRVHLQLPNGTERRCVVKIGTHAVIEKEVGVLHILKEVGLSVPEVLSEPIPVSSEERTLVVLSELAGTALPWCGISTLAEADLACRLTLEGVARLHEITERVQAHPAANTLPKHTLWDEYTSIVEQLGAWAEVETVQKVVEALREVLPHLDTPLVFTNGDYNPINFLTDGQRVSGFVDFEGACFENPHIGFVKFLLWGQDDYGWGTGVKAGLVERYLYSQNISRREFSPLLLLRGLRHLILETSLEENDREWREHYLSILELALRELR